MALIPCKECGNMVSELAPTCPVCGCPVAYSMNQQTVSQQNPQSNQQTVWTPAPVPPVDGSPAHAEKKSKNGGKIALICGLSLVGLAILTGVFFLVWNLLQDSGGYSATNPNSQFSMQSPAAPTGTGSAVEQAYIDGSWTSQFMDTVIFEVVDGQRVRRTRRYDYERGSRVEDTCVVREVTEDIITCIHEDGTLESILYTTYPDGVTLALDGIVYQKTAVTTDATLMQYEINATPAFGNTYFGMTREEIMKFASFTHDWSDPSGLKEFYSLPETGVLSDANDGFMTCEFDTQDRLMEVNVYLYVDPDDVDKTLRWKQQILTHFADLYAVNTNIAPDDDYESWHCGAFRLTYMELSSDGTIVMSFAVNQ